MTVADLIKQLQSMPQDAIIKVWVEGSPSTAEPVVTVTHHPEHNEVCLDYY